MKGELENAVPGALVVDDPAELRRVSRDATEARGLIGRAEALVLASSADDVAATLAWCYRHDVALTTRGGGTGFAGGAVPDGGVVLSLERMNQVRSVNPGQWRMEAEAGCSTAQIQRVARENGLLFPPDPGAAENSSLGGNIATNAGGPHAYRYGVTGNWVTGLETVLAPGEIVRFGGPWRKDVSGYDLLHLLVGSEGTLGIVTAAWLRLVPAPESQAVVIAFYDRAEIGCETLRGVAEAGIQATALEFLDHGTLSASLAAFPFAAPVEAEFAVLAAVDGHASETARVSLELVDVLGMKAIDLLRLDGRSEIESLWKWRDGVSIAVTARRGGKVSEDIVVPVDRLAEAVQGTVEIGRRHGLEACSWGHGGDGNLHSTFLVDRANDEDLRRAEQAADDLFALTLDLGGSISGEHGIGSVKSGWVQRALGARRSELQRDVKGVFDPKNLLNPGKKLGPAQLPPAAS